MPLAIAEQSLFIQSLPPTRAVWQTLWKHQGSIHERQQYIEPRQGCRVLLAWRICPQPNQLFNRTSSSFAGSRLLTPALGIMEYIRPIISGLIGAIVVGFLMAWIGRAKPSALAPGEIRHSSRMRAVSILILVIASFIAYAAVHASPGQRWLALSIGALSLGFGIWFVLEAFLVRAQASDSHLIHYAPWRGRRSIPWSSINGYEFSNSNNLHVLSTEGHGKVRLSTYLLGVDQVADRLNKWAETEYEA